MMNNDVSVARQMLIPHPVSYHKPLLLASHLMIPLPFSSAFTLTVHFHLTSHCQQWTKGNIYMQQNHSHRMPFKIINKVCSEKLKMWKNERKSLNLEIMWVSCNNGRACIPNCAFEKTIWRGLISLMWLTHEQRPNAQSRNNCGEAAFHLLSAQHQPNHFCSCQKHLRSQVIFNFPQRER